MPKGLEYREVIRRLKAERKQLEVHIRRGKGSHRMVYDPSTRLHYPLPHHGDDKQPDPQGDTEGINPQI